MFKMEKKNEKKKQKQEEENWKTGFQVQTLMPPSAHGFWVLYLLTCAKLVVSCAPRTEPEKQRIRIIR